MNKIMLVGALCLLGVLPTITHAGPILRSGEKISIDSEQVLEGDFYAFASTISVSGLAKGDVSIVGGTVTINAPVQQDLTIIGGVVQVHGEVGDDVRIIGGEVTLAEAVKGDVVVLGGTLTILPTATIGGDILFMGGDLTVEGVVTGGIHGTSDTIRINTEIGGDISYVVAKSFTLGDRARVKGSLTYESLNTIIRAQDALVEGEIHKTEKAVVVSNNSLKFFVLQVCIVLFAALALFLALRKQLQHVGENLQSSIGTSGLIGLGVFFVLPFISSIFMVSVIGIFVGIALFILYILALLIALVTAGIMFGLYLQILLTKQRTITIATIGLGVSAFSLLTFIPYVGGFLIFAGIIVTLGGISTSLYRTLRS